MRYLGFRGATTTPPPTPVNTTPPSIPQTAVEGETITVTPGVWTNAGTIVGELFINGLPASPPITGLTYDIGAIGSATITYRETTDGVTATSNALTVIPDLTLLPGYTGYYKASGFVDSGSGTLQEWTENSGAALSFTQANAARRVPISGNAIDFGSPNNGTLGMTAPTWPAAPKTIVYFMQHHDPSAIYWDDYNDWTGGTTTANRFATLGTGASNRFWAQQSGGRTERNGIPTGAILPTREPTAVALVKDSGLDFTVLGNRAAYDRSFDGLITGILVLSETLDEAGWADVMAVGAAEHGTAIPTTAFGDYASIYDVTNDVELFSQGSVAHSFNPDSMVKAITAMMIYDLIDAGGATYSTNITVEPTDGAVFTPYIASGGTYTLGYLLNVAMVESNNTAAYAIGRWHGDQLAVDGGVAEWATAANAFIAGLGMTATALTVPDGEEPSMAIQFMSVGDARILARAISTGANYSVTPAGGVSLHDIMSTGTFNASGTNIDHSCPTIRFDDVSVGAKLSAKGGFITRGDAVARYERADGRVFALTVSDMPAPNTNDKRWAELAGLVERCEFAT